VLALAVQGRGKVLWRLVRDLHVYLLLLLGAVRTRSCGNATTTACDVDCPACAAALYVPLHVLVICMIGSLPRPKNSEHAAFFSAGWPCCPSATVVAVLALLSVYL
jgi:hypothetical protein